MLPIKELFLGRKLHKCGLFWHEIRYLRGFLHKIPNTLEHFANSILKKGNVGLFYSLLDNINFTLLLSILLF